MKKINKELAIEKGLIINDDYTKYNYIVKLYKKGLDIILNNIVDFKDIDNRIVNSRLYFSPSKTLLKSKKNININSNYFACLNPLFVEKIEIKDINILLQKKDIDEDVLKIIQNTLKDVLKKDGVSKVCYNPPMPKHIVENGAIVLEFLYGKNSKKLSGDAFFENNRVQKEFIDEMKKYIKNKIKNSLNINTEIFVRKAV